MYKTILWISIRSATITRKLKLGWKRLLKYNTIDNSSYKTGCLSVPKDLANRCTEMVNNWKEKIFMYRCKPLGAVTISIKQGKGNVILTNNSKWKFPFNPFPLFLPFFPLPFQLNQKNKFYSNKIFIFRQFHMELIGWIAAPAMSVR